MRIRIVAPSSPFFVDRLTAGVARLRAAGCTVDDEHAQSAVLEGRHAYLTSNDDDRLRSLQEALHSDVDVIWLARGGYGLTRIVSRLDIPLRPPIMIGFSDATALFGARSGVSCVHGPLATTIACEPAWSFDHCMAVLHKRAQGASFDVSGEAINVEGWLFAANLCVLTALCGTPAMPSLDGAILVLEEVGERPYRIDRMLTQLKDSGAFAGVRAVIVGHLTGCEEPASSSAEPSQRDPAPAALDVFRERIRSTGVPMFSGIAVGHQAPNIALPLGARAKVQGGKLTLLENVQ